MKQMARYRRTTTIPEAVAGLEWAGLCARLFLKLGFLGLGPDTVSAQDLAAELCHRERRAQQGAKSVPSPAQDLAVWFQE